MFAEDLQGHRLLTNRSIWRNFPTIRCERWVADNIVLLGDAKATAHFSIGSGTKLAMEDAIALYEAFRATGDSDVDDRAAHFESRRREEVEKTQHAADVSLVWFEHVDRFWDMDPTQFAFGADDALQGDHLRQSRAARAGLRQRGRSGSWPRDVRALGLRGRDRKAARADVPAVPRCAA